MKTTFFKTAAVAAFVLAASATAQETAYVPFKVNVPATITATPNSGTAVSMTVAANEEKVMILTLNGSSSISNQSRTQGLLNAPAITTSRGNISLRLPAQSYQNAEIALYSVNGRQILRGKASATETANSISRRNVAAGAYLLSVKGINGNVFTTRLTHNGGKMNINAAFGTESVSPDRRLGKSAADGNWTINVSARVEGGYRDSLYTFSPKAGLNATQDITLIIPPKIFYFDGTWKSDNDDRYNQITIDGNNWIYSEGTRIDNLSEYSKGTWSANIPLAASSSGIITFTATHVKTSLGWISLPPEYNSVKTNTAAFEINSAASVFTLSNAALTTDGVWGTLDGVYMKYLHIVDSRDDKIYKIVKIDSQWWMAENLNCEAAGGVCYDNDYANCKKYGRLYNWNEAIEACPTGWHLPSDAEWDTLINYVGGSSTAGKKLKATSGWCDSLLNYCDWDGTDDYGFSALPGGHGDSKGNFYFSGVGTQWSSATEDGYTGFGQVACCNMILYMQGNGIVEITNRGKTELHSVRCVQD